MDISMDIHVKSVDMVIDIDMNVKIHIHGNSREHRSLVDKMKDVW